MKNIFILLFSFYLLNGLNGQSKPIFFPDQIENSSDLHLKCYCKPGIANQSRSKGIELSFQGQGSRLYGETENYTLQEPHTAVKSSTNIEFKFKVPIINQAGLKFLIGYGYNQERYQIDRVGVDQPMVFNQLSSALFKSNNLSAYFTKSFNETNYMAFRGRLIYNGNYDGLIQFDKRYRFYNLVGIWGHKKSEDFEWGLGISVGKSIKNNTQIIPLAMLNVNFSPKWGLESVLPAFVFIRNNVNAKTMLFYGAEITGQGYVFDLEGQNTATTPSYIFDDSNVRLVASLERKLMNWIWLSAKVGYNLTFSTEFLSNADELYPSFEVEPMNHPFIKLGLFLSPPNNLIK